MCRENQLSLICDMLVLIRNFMINICHSHICGFSIIVNLLGSSPDTVLHSQCRALGYKSGETQIMLKGQRLVEMAWLPQKMLSYLTFVLLTLLFNVGGTVCYFHNNTIKC